MLLKEIEYEGVLNSCDLDKGQWKALVNMVVNFLVPKRAANFFLSYY
jgi:hypothetical protein